MKYIQRYNGKGWAVLAGRPTRICCCDCGLVHDIVFVASKDRKQIGIAARVNKRATTQRRKNNDANHLCKPYRKK